MTSSNHWPKSRAKGNKRTSNDDLDISWTSSSSESECFCFNNKQFKAQYNFAKSWIHLSKMSPNLSFSYEEPNEIVNNTSDESTDNVYLQKKSSELHLDNFEEPLSPVIGKPISFELSPVLNNDKICLLSKPSRRNNLFNSIQNNSFDSNRISESDSSDSSDHPEVILNTQSQKGLNSSLQRFDIDLISTQESTYEKSSELTHELSTNVLCEESSPIVAPEIVTQTLSSEIPNINSSNIVTLGSNSSTKKRRKHRKKSLSYKLQKALKKQNCDHAIWQHELYLNKTENYEITNFHNDNLALLLLITKFWKEFEINVLECQLLNGEPEIQAKFSNLFCNDSNLIDNCSKIDLDLCIIVFGSVIHDLNIQIDAKFKLYPPYKTKIIKYYGKRIISFYNVLKILSIK